MTEYNHNSTTTESYSALDLINTAETLELCYPIQMLKKCIHAFIIRFIMH